jgi:hypothetical protein
VFPGGFALAAAQAVAGMTRWSASRWTCSPCSSPSAGGGRQRGEPNLLPAVGDSAPVRGRKLGESGEADALRSRHRDCYTAMAVLLDAPAGRNYEQRLEQSQIEIDNLRAAFGWSRETPISRWRRHPRCSRCGSRGAAFGKGPGLVRHRHPGGRRRQPRSGSAGPGDRARSMTRPCARGL